MRQRPSGQPARRKPGPVARVRGMGVVTCAGLAIGLALGLTLPIPAAGQTAAPDDQVQRPTAARRLVRTFTFDEPNNPNPVPDGWVRVQDLPGGIGVGSAPKTGFPWFNLAEFDHTQGASGTSSVLLPTKGGSTALRLEGGEIPIFPDADYTVSARVKTGGLEHARAFLTARLLDQRLQPIEGSQVRSEPVISPAGWTVVRIVVPGKFENAAFMQIDLDLLQPAQFNKPVDPSVAQHVVKREDISGSAWFDDVSVALVPRSTFQTATASGLFSGKDKPALVMTARDQGGDVLTGHLRVLDIDGAVVDEHTTRLDPSGTVYRWEPSIQRYGWYRAILDIDASGVQVSRSERWIGYLPGGTPGKVRPGSGMSGSGGGGGIRSEDLARFGLIADTVNERTLSDLPAFIDAARTRFIVIPAFDANVDQNHAREALNARMPAIDALLNRNQQVTFALSSVPPTLAGAMLLDPSDAIGLSTRDAMAWRPFLDPTIDVYGQRVLRYQVGRFGDQNIVRQNGAPGLQNAERIISRLVPGPKMILPWRADHGLPSYSRSDTEMVDSGKPNSPSNVSSGPLVDGVTIQFPLGFAPGAMRDLALVRDDQHARGNTMELTVVPECPEIEKFGAKARAIEMAKRLAEFWAALAATPQGVPQARFALNSPWSIVDQEGDALVQPAPEVPALVHMSERLAGRRVIGPVPAPEGVRAMLLVERSGTSQSLRAGEALSRACVIAWNESALPENAYVKVFTPHSGVEIADIFGNVREVSQDASGIQTRIDLTDAPIFIEGVDAYLALLSASFKFTPQFLPATATQHEHRIELTNPWPVRITGQMQLREAEKPGQKLRSGDWTITPNVMEFAIAPGQSIALPVTLEFGAGTLAGVKDFQLVVKVTADRQYPPIKLDTSIEVGLKDLDLTTEVQVGSGQNAKDVIVIATVINRGDRVRALRIDLAAKDVPSQQRQVSELQPGETIQRQFVIRDGVRLLGGRHARVTLVDEESAARLNKAAFIPAAR